MDDVWRLTSVTDAIRLTNVRTGQSVALADEYVHHFIVAPPDDETFHGWLELTVKVDLTNARPEISPLHSGPARVLKEDDAPPWHYRLRELLDRINPEILRAVDGGALTQPVMVADFNIPSLRALCKEPDAAGVLMLHADGCVIGGGTGNRIGGHLHDLSEGGPMQGFVLLFDQQPRRG